MIFLFIGQAFAQNKKSTSKKIETTEHYTFQLNDMVTRKKVSFKNRYGITLSGDLYLQAFMAIVPNNSAKEQTDNSVTLV